MLFFEASPIVSAREPWRGEIGRTGTARNGIDRGGFSSPTFPLSQFPPRECPQTPHHPQPELQGSHEPHDSPGAVPQPCGTLARPPAPRVIGGRAGGGSGGSDSDSDDRGNLQGAGGGGGAAGGPGEPRREPEPPGPAAPLGTAAGMGQRLPEAGWVQPDGGRAGGWLD